MKDRLTPIREFIRSDAYSKARDAILAVCREDLDHSDLLALCRLRRRILKGSPDLGSGKAIKVALLGGASTEMLEAPLALMIEATGLQAVFYRADFNAYAGEMLLADSATCAFEPDVAIVVTTPANISSWPVFGDSRDEVRERVEEACDHWLNLCRSLHGNTGCEIVLDNFHAPATRALGNLGAKLPWDPLSFTRALNLELGMSAPEYVHIHDVDALASAVGTRNWFDPRFWFHAKQPMSHEAIPVYAKSVSRMIGGIFGMTRKCLVLDLDNTLWGGVVGDDGVDGIRIGEGDAIGEAFKAFQKYVLELKNRGILLAVCSKNEESNALEPFEKHPEMLLQRDDFVAFQANWNPKPDNILKISEDLNIGVDSLVFVDDNPVEREHVRQRLPEVQIIELTDDPADYPRLLDAAGCFEAPALSSEDTERTEQYRANAERTRHRESVTDYASYLASLEQRAIICPFQNADLDRITQLINKSNQFNLTTRRLSRSQVEQLASTPLRLNRSVRLVDRFGDNGLILVFSGKLAHGILEIDLWLMSCRVLKRGMENFLMNHVVEAAMGMGATEIRGTYSPTPKNGLVADLYPSLGFSERERLEDGTTHWSLSLERFEPAENQIAEVDHF